MLPKATFPGVAPFSTQADRTDPAEAFATSNHSDLSKQASRRSSARSFVPLTRRIVSGADEIEKGKWGEPRRIQSVERTAAGCAYGDCMGVERAMGQLSAAAGGGGLGRIAIERP